MRKIISRWVPLVESRAVTFQCGAQPRGRWVSTELSGKAADFAFKWFDALKNGDAMIVGEKGESLGVIQLVVRGQEETDKRKVAASMISELVGAGVLNSKYELEESWAISSMLKLFIKKGKGVANESTAIL